MSDPILSVRGLSKRFGSLDVLHDISFDVARGSVVALVGESGSGKSTIARIIARLLDANAGEVLFDGRDILKTRPTLSYRQRVQMIFQDPFGSLNPVNTIGYHLARPLLRHGHSAERGDILALLEQVGLSPAEEYIDQYPHSLSGGQRQRVAIARALAPQPELVLADEPTSMLDVSIRMDVLNLLDGLRRDKGMAYIFITHDLASARYLANRVLVLYQGRIVEDAPADELVAAPAHPYTRVLLSAAAGGDGAYADRAPTQPDAGSGGCPFAPRCPEATSECRTPPPLRVVGDRRVACHHLKPNPSPSP